MVLLTAAYILGVLSTRLIEISSGAALAAAGFIFILSVIGCVLLRDRNYMAILLLFMTIGFFMSCQSKEQAGGVLPGCAGSRIVIEGTVCKEADIRKDKVYYTLEAERLLQGPKQREIKEKVLIKVSPEVARYNYGDILRLEGYVVLPDEPGNPGQFNYKSYLARRGIGSILLVSGDDRVMKIGSGGNLIAKTVLGVKQKLAGINRSTLPPDEASLVNGIVFGLQGEIDRQTWEEFSRTGVVHILSVSGLHVGLVIGGLLFLLSLFRVSHSYNAPLITVALVVYAVMCGFGPAVARATVMAVMLLWAHHMDRNYDWPTTLSCAALLILLFQPLSVFDVGFQFSFAATWGILFFGPVIDEKLKAWFPQLGGKMAGYIRAVVWVTLSAQLATLPLSIWYYNIVSPVALVANIVAVPLTGAVLALGMVASMSGLVFMPLSGLINSCTSLVLNMFTMSVSFLNSLPGAVFYLPTFSCVFVVLYYVALISLVKSSPVKCFKTRLKLSGICLYVTVLAAGIVVVIICQSNFYGNSGQLKVHFIDVGQGDAILVQTPAGKNMLVDSGGWVGEFDSGTGSGDRVVVPYLRRLGIGKLDALVLTHPHEDHAAGAAAVARGIKVNSVIVCPVDYVGYSEAACTEKVHHAYKKTVKNFGSQRITVSAALFGYRLHLDPDVKIDVLHPRSGYPEGHFNENSVVLRMCYGRRSFLLTGDIEIETQKLLAGMGSRIQSDVIKVPHHGSSLQYPFFYSTVRPQVAVISVGRKNRFGMPAPETMRLLKNSGAVVYRTDLNGAIVITTDGETLWVETGVKKVKQRLISMKISTRLEKWLL